VVSVARSRHAETAGPYSDVPMFDDQSVGNASGNVGRCHRFDVRDREMSLLVHNKVRRAIAMLLGERPKLTSVFLPRMLLRKPRDLLET
jgi:hypothetical protein